MTGDGKNISAATREKALVLIECAKGIGINPGTFRFNNTQDVVSFWFTNGLLYIIIFCSPHGYLIEIHSSDQLSALSYGIVKNIRNFLFFVRKKKLECVDEYFTKLAESVELDDEDLRDIVDEIEE